MSEVNACLTHGRIRVNGKWAQLTLRSQDLDKAFEFLGLTIVDCTCDHCIHILDNWLKLLEADDVQSD